MSYTPIIMTSFEQLKNICTAACHSRHACAEGFLAMLAAENVSQLMAVWRDNWEDLVESKYADIINEQLPAIYPSLKEEMNAAGIYVNECPQTAPEYVLVIVTDYDYIININDLARCYILGKAYVRAWDHSQVYSEKSDACVVQLFNYSYGHISCGWVEAHDYSRLWTSTFASLNGGVKCEAHDGVIQANCYLKIEAYGDTKVFSNTDRNITLYGNAKIIV